MAIAFGSENYGDIRVQDVMIDVDGTNLEEGIDIISMDDMFETISVVGVNTWEYEDEYGSVNWEKIEKGIVKFIEQ